MKLSAVLTGLAFAALHVSDPVDAYTNPITIKSYKMYDAKTGKYFGVKGVDYYPRPNAGELNENNRDFFSDDHEAIWGPDIEYLAGVGANAVRLYAVDPTLGHDKFMCALRSHGMYALVDFGASCEGCAITNDVYPTCYPAKLKTRGKMIIDAFAKYDNVLAFSAGNEINNVVTRVTDNAPCQKKFLRDMRVYMASCATFRQIPIGVVLADPGNQRGLNAKYYNCRTNASDVYENAEWYGLNVYLQCNGALTDPKVVGPGFQQAFTDFASFGLNIPVMFTEFGCLNPSFHTVNKYEAQRTWLQAAWIHSKDLREQFNGGFAFEYSTERANSEADSPYPFIQYGGQNYGLGYFSPVTCNHDTVKCVYNPMPNYNSLATQYNATDYTDEPAMAEFTPAAGKVDFPACPSNFTKLSDIDWTTVDSIPFACPADPQEYTCPGQESSGKWTKGELGTPTATTPKPVETPPPAPTTTTTTSPTATPTPTPTATLTTKKSDAASVVQSAVVALVVATTAVAVFF